MPIGLVAQSQAQLDAAEKRLNDARDAVNTAQAALRDLRKSPPSPEREIQIIGQQAHIATLQDAVHAQAATLQAAQNDHANVLAGRKQQASGIEHALKELSIIQLNDPRALLEFETALRELIESKAKGITYAGPLVGILDRCERERREVAYSERKLASNRAGLAQYDGVPDAIEPTPAAKPTRVKAA